MHVRPSYYSDLRMRALACMYVWFVDIWEAGELLFVPLGAEFKGLTTTVLRSRATALPTAGAARVEKRKSRL